MPLPLSRLAGAGYQPQIGGYAGYGNTGPTGGGLLDFPGNQGEGGPETTRLDPHAWEHDQQQAYYASKSPLGYKLNALFGRGKDVGSQLIHSARHGQLQFGMQPPDRYTTAQYPDMAPEEHITGPHGFSGNLGGNPSQQRLLSRLRTMEVGGERRNLMRQNRGGV